MGRRSGLHDLSGGIIDSVYYRFTKLLDFFYLVKTVLLFWSVTISGYGNDDGCHVHIVKRKAGNLTAYGYFVSHIENELRKRNISTINKPTTGSLDTLLNLEKVASGLGLVQADAQCH